MRSEKVVFATHFAPALDLFNQKLDRTAWKSKASWYIVGRNDRTVHPELQRFAAKRMGAAIYETDSSHVRILSQPSVVLDVIRAAATVIQGFAVGVA
jgi:pimeloyl-ACP methyl ester carboxylesterase